MQSQAMRGACDRMGRGGARALVAAVMALVLAVVGCSAASGQAQALSSASFYDVAGHWAVSDPNAGGANWIDYVASHGIMTGRTENGKLTGQFSPDDDILRCDLATTLYRMANPDSDATTNAQHFGTTATFSDERTGEYYTAAIEWCYRTGIMTGDTRDGQPTGTVRPYDPIKREELATMLYRFARVMSIDVGDGQVLGYDDSAYKSMPDCNSVDDYAVAAMGWGASLGIIGSGGSLNPHALATRAETAKMLALVDQDALSNVPAYGMLYNDGTLVLQRGGVPDASRGGRLTVDQFGKVTVGGTLVGRWGGIEGLTGVVPWTTANSADVKRVVVDDAVKPTDADQLFASLPNLKSVDLTNLDLSAATSVRYMFMNDTSLTAIDLSATSVNSKADSYGIIAGCTALTSVKLGSGSASLAGSLTVDGTAWSSSDGTTYRPSSSAATVAHASLMSFAAPADADASGDAPAAGSEPADVAQTAAADAAQPTVADVGESPLQGAPEGTSQVSQEPGAEQVTADAPAEHAAADDSAAQATAQAQAGAAEASPDVDTETADADASVDANGSLGVPATDVSDAAA